MKENFAFIVLMLISTAGFGQTEQFGIEKLTINDGLAHNTVECVFKDSEGYVWIGTHYGLSRYDGYNMSTFRKDYNDSTTLTGNRISAIIEDSDQRLWIGTTHGLNRFNKETEKFKRYYRGKEIGDLASHHITMLKVIDSMLWIGTNKGLFKHDESKDIFIPFLPERDDSTFSRLIIYDIMKTSTGQLLVASENSCIHELNMDTKTFTPIHYKRTQWLNRNYRKHIVEDSNGNIWISAYSHGLVKLNLKTFESYNYNTKNSNIGSDLLNGSMLWVNNMLWFTTDGNGIGVYNEKNGAFDNIGSLNPLIRDKIDTKHFTLYNDNEDIIWLGGFTTGLTILNPNSQKIQNTCEKFEPGDFYGQSIVAIYQDTKGTLWIGTDGNGLFAINTNGIKHYMQIEGDNNSISSNRIVSINEDPKGNILAGAYNGGLNVINPATGNIINFSPNRFTNSISGQHVWSICKESDTKIWLGFLGEGVNLYNPAQQTFLDYGPTSANYNRVNHGSIHCIMMDSDGDIWFGTEGAGINILSNITDKIYYSLPSPNTHALQENEVYSIYQDTNGFIWLASDDGGLYKYSKYDRLLTHYPLTNMGNNNNMVQSIIEGKPEELWLGLNKGLAQFNTNTLDYKYYETGEGLPGNICNRNAVLKLKNGQILIGTTNGIAVLHPDSIKDNKYTPMPYLSGFRLNNKLIEIGEMVNKRVLLKKHINKTNALTLKPNENIFTIEFGSFNYTLQNECSFQFMLEGFESDWKTVDASRKHATYTNLTPGNYIFKLKASNNDGKYSNYIKTIEITVLPNFYQSKLFKAILGLLLLIVVYVIYRFALHKKLKKYTEKQLLSENRIMQLEKENIEQQLNQQAFSIINRNKSLFYLRKRLSFLIKRLDEKNKNSIHEIIEHINDELDEERDWKQIEPRLDSVYNNFMTRLQDKEKQLTPTELRICAYIKMGLSTKEISEIMQKSLKAVENDRYRLRKKLNINPDDSLKSYLLHV